MCAGVHGALKDGSPIVIVRAGISNIAGTLCHLLLVVMVVMVVMVVVVVVVVVVVKQANSDMACTAWSR